MKQFDVIMTPFAAENIQEAYAWYQVETPPYADKWLGGLRVQILGLETMPKSHGLAPEDVMFVEEIRPVIFGLSKRWRILFTVEGQTVYVLHVRHASRDDWAP